MVELPIKLMDIILSFSSRNDFVQLSTVSRKWQFVVECHTMSTVYIKGAELQDFFEIFAHHNRRAALRKLTFDVLLPSYSDEQCARFETQQDKQQNNKVLTDAVHSLFSVLHSWDEKVGMVGNGIASYQRPVIAGHISLELKAYSPSDEVSWAAKTDKDSLYEDRFQRSFLQISSCDELLTVPRICDFEATDLCFRHIEGASLAGVAAKLPNLEKICWQVCDDDRVYAAMRQQRRFDFARSLAMLPIQSLKRVKLDIFNYAPENHHLNIPSALLPSAPSVDHLSIALHTLSQSPNLTYLHLGGVCRTNVLSPCFFWPQHPANLAPFWPHLQELIVELDITTPEGNWLYKRDPEDDNVYGFDEQDHPNPLPNDLELTLSDLLELANLLGIGPGNETSTQLSKSEIPQTFNNKRLQSLFDSYDLEYWFHNNFPREELMRSAMSFMEGSLPLRVFRTIIDGELLNPMLMAMARAARHMPTLQHMRLSITNDPGCSVYNSRPPSVCLEIEEKNERMTTMRKKRWLVSTGTSQWKVPDDLLAAWKNVGTEDDDEVVIEFVG